ncbi:MAG: hypothetical protein U0822_28775, partial [Anaerolineae bacterium]
AQLARPGSGLLRPDCNNHAIPVGVAVYDAQLMPVYIPTNIYAKLGAANRAEAVRIAVEHNML